MTALKKQLAATSSAASDDFLLAQLQDLASDPFAVTLDDTFDKSGRKRKREREVAKDTDHDAHEDSENKENEEPKAAPGKTKEIKPVSATVVSAPN